MKWYRLNGRVLTLMLALAFFNFIFLFFIAGNQSATHKVVTES